MSIFGRADRQLPLVTQAAQVDVNDPAEVRNFWIRCAALTELKAVYEQEERPLKPDDQVFPDGTVIDNSGEVFTPISDDLLLNTMEMDAQRRLDLAFEQTFPTGPSFDEETGPESFGESLLEDLGDVVSLVQRLLNPLCDRAAVDLHSLTALRRKCPARHNIEADPTKFLAVSAALAADQMDQVPEEMPLTAFLPASWRDVYTPHEALASDFETVLFELWLGKATLLRCPECQSVFVSYRKGQRYCSHRCSNRVSLRTRRNAAKK